MATREIEELFQGNLQKESIDEIFSVLQSQMADKKGWHVTPANFRFEEIIVEKASDMIIITCLKNGEYQTVFVILPSDHVVITSSMIFFENNKQEEYSKVYLLWL